jgi:hypothetical protein
LPAPQLPQQKSSQKFFFSPALREIIKAFVPVKKMAINFHETGIQNAKEDQQNE